LSRAAGWLLGDLGTLAQEAAAMPTFLRSRLVFTPSP
jgi:hypothetical protein